MNRLLAVVACVPLVLVSTVAQFRSPRAEAGDKVAAPIEFNRDIRPILSQNCFQCHGPDSKHREAELRLDQEAGIQKAFRVKSLEKSEAWTRMNSKDDDERMPPPAAHKELKSAEIALVRRWIEQGAPWQAHWAFISPMKPATPQVKDSKWVRNPIDAFMLQHMEQAGLHPTAEADRERLLRRVTFDLTGLPPTTAEIDAFLADTSADAYEKVVDRLLASPHYGERMALNWMDAARYGDSSAFHADGPRDMWPWRDWVINAYNSNMPFNQFTLDQLAGDLVPNSTVEQKIATGFCRNNCSSDEGGVIPEEYRVEYAVDRVKTTAMVWMGLTMECAQCHDHKFDPITQREYYQYFAYFNQSSDPGMQTRRGNQAPVVDVPDLSRSKKLPQLQSQRAALEKQRAALDAAASPGFAAWLAKGATDSKQAVGPPTDEIVHITLDEKSGSKVSDAANPKNSGTVRGKAEWTPGQFDGAFQCSAKSYIDVGNVASFDRTDAFSYGAWIKPSGSGEGAPLSRMDDKNDYRGFDLYISGGRPAVHLIHQWPSDAIKVVSQQALTPGKWQHVLATYDGSGTAAGVKIYIDGKSQQLRVEVNQLRGTMRNDVTLLIGRRTPGSVYSGLVDDVKIFTRKLLDNEVAMLAGNDPIRPLLAMDPKKRTPQQLAMLRNYYVRELDPAFKTLTTQIQVIDGQIMESSRPISTVMVMRDEMKPRMTYILDRGAYDAPKKDSPVQPGVPSTVMPAPPGSPPNRLGLAQWLTRPDHPLTSRVAVNRLWYTMFGTGLVRTLEDFGSQGEPPTHAELLDYLAVDFVEHNWDVKRMLRQIVTSATYRQSSRVSRELLELDPENRLLARGARFRLQGEFIRDNALAAAGLLNAKIGGPSVKPYQPAGLWEEVALDPRGSRFVQDHGDQVYRRSMYIYWKRSAPTPNMSIFDAPSREKCTLRRARTNTPLQALVTLNDPQFLEAARGLGQRAMREGGATPDERIAFALRVATAVRGRPHTLAVLRQAYEEELALFRREPARALKVISVGESPKDAKLDPAELAAMTIVSSMILNLDETLTRG